MYGNTCETTGFEGPEKRLEIDFKPNARCPKGLRSLSRDQINELLELAKCTIVSSKRNQYFDSYVLSESSLFIYPNKLMIKTCGTTTLLKCIPKLLEYTIAMELGVELVRYSRKNFLFPHKQAYPHLRWSDEVDYLNTIFDGNAYVLGPLTESHWYLYLADYSERRNHSKQPEITLEVMMHDLEPQAAKRFYRREGIQDNTKFVGIADLLPGSETDEFNFTPCGYSMNGLWERAYYTIHVTPEPHCSYASFETNVTLSSYTMLLASVCQIFKPGSLTVTLFNETGLPDHHLQQEFDLNIVGYNMKHKTFSELDNSDVHLCTYKVSNQEAISKRKAQPTLPQSSTHFAPGE